MKAQTHSRHVRVFFAIAVFTFILTNRAWGVNYTAIDLNPSGFFNNSCAYGTSGTQQVGWGFGSASGYYEHALLWSGSADSYVDLNPSGFDWSYAYWTDGTQQVGYGSGSATGYFWHALFWSGSADSYIDLNPSGFYQSVASGTNGTQQVGYGYGSATVGQTHALLWNGSAESCIDLNPSGFDYSDVFGSSGTQQVGSGYGAATGGNLHALLWNGTVASCVDLNPSGFDWSYAYWTNGTQQVGGGIGSATDGYQHALLWNGTAASYIDLHQFLPIEFLQSGALSIDGYGNIVGYATDSSGYQHAFLWQPIPETDPIQEILDFIEESVSDGTLVPVRTGPSGKGQLGALVNMIEAAGKLIKDKDIKGACGQLHAALGKTDGKGQPPDFVKGEASVELAQMIQELMASLGCR